MLATVPAGCWFPSKVWRAVLCFLEFFKNTFPALMVQAWVLVYQHVWKWHFAVPVIISLYFLSFDFALEVLVLKMSHRKQKLRFFHQKKKAVEFYFLGLSFAGSSYFMRTVWASYATLRCFGISLRSSPWLPSAPAGSQSHGAVAARVGIAFCWCRQVTVFKKPQL